MVISLLRSIFLKFAFTDTSKTCVKVSSILFTLQTDLNDMKDLMGSHTPKITMESILNNFKLAREGLPNYHKEWQHEHFLGKLVVPTHGWWQRLNWDFSLWTAFKYLVSILLYTLEYFPKLEWSLALHPSSFTEDLFHLIQPKGQLIQPG